MTGSGGSVASTASLLVPEPGGERVLAVETDVGLAPPVVDLGDRWWTGHTEAAVRSVEEQFALVAPVVDARHVADHHFAIRLDEPAPDWRLPERALWVHPATLAESPIAAFLHGPESREAWLRAGWHAEAIEWIDEQLGAVGRERTGAPRQLKHWSIGSVMRVPARPGDAVFKEVPSYFAHEGAVIAVLASVDPALVPEVLALGERRLLMAAFDGPRTEAAGDPELDECLRAFARLQLACAARADDLLAAGAPRRSPEVLARDLEALAAREELIAANPKDLDPAVLSRQIDGLTERCAALSDLGIPLTIGHGDFHQWNVTRTAAGWVVYDWTDSSVTHPFFDLCPWLWHIDDPVARTRARDAYLDEWRSALGEDGVVNAWSLAEPLACANYAIDYVTLADGVGTAHAGEWAGAIGVWLRRAFDALAQQDGR